MYLYRRVGWEKFWWVLKGVCGIVERGIPMSLSGSAGGEAGIAWTPSRAYGPHGNSTSLPLTMQLPTRSRGNKLFSFLPCDRRDMHWTHEREMSHSNYNSYALGFCSRKRTKPDFEKGRGLYWSVTGVTQRIEWESIASTTDMVQCF